MFHSVIYFRNKLRFGFVTVRHETLVAGRQCHQKVAKRTGAKEQVLAKVRASAETGNLRKGCSIMEHLTASVHK